MTASENSHPETPEEETFSLSSGCPWLNKQGAKNPIVNPRNMMPDIPQTASEGQTVELSRVRETSSIPKTGSEMKWEYPSPQQFYNALLRRNKTAEEDTMDMVVHVHNAVNEDSWKQVLEWERMYEHQCKEPSLQRFVGKSEEPSLKSRLRKTLGLLNGEELFDRHDWFVDRCGEKTVRYIIDYYDTSGCPDVHDPTGFNVRIDTRPALDSFQSVLDRIRKPLYDIWNRK